MKKANYFQDGQRWHKFKHKSKHLQGSQKAETHVIELMHYFFHDDVRILLKLLKKGDKEACILSVKWNHEVI